MFFEAFRPRKSKGVNNIPRLIVLFYHDMYSGPETLLIIAVPSWFDSLISSLVICILICWRFR